MELHCEALVSQYYLLCSYCLEAICGVYVLNDLDRKEDNWRGKNVSLYHFKASRHFLRISMKKSFIWAWLVKFSFFAFFSWYLNGENASC